MPLGRHRRRWCGIPTATYPAGNFGNAMTDLATLLKAEVGLQVATVDVRVTVVVVTEFGRRVAMNASDSESARSAPFFPAGHQCRSAWPAPAEHRGGGFRGAEPRSMSHRECKYR